MRAVLSKMSDIERLASRIALEKAHAKDLQALRTGLEQWLSIRTLCERFAPGDFSEFGEGIGEVVESLVREELRGSFVSKIGAMLMLPALKRIMAKFEYEKNGGSPLLGVDGIVIKAHGNSKGKAKIGRAHV